MRRKPRFYQTKSFQSLSREWDSRLLASGFKDIERGHHGTVIQDLSERIGFKPNVKEANEEYYHWARSILQKKLFRSQRHRFIWLRHIEGDSAASIGRKIKLSRWRISDILTEIKIYLKSLEKIAKNH